MTPLHPGLLPGTASVPFARDLACHGDRTALVTGDGRTLSYRQLAARVEAVARRLGPQRRLLLLPGANDPGALTVYLAALAAGHPVLLVPGGTSGAVRALADAYDPDIVVHPPAAGGDGAWEIEELRPVSAHSLHPELALLLSTSGTTGSPKLVRLSRENLQSNAEAIAGYLGIRDTDRAATTLPMHYCYGLSVLHSHLLRGAALVLTSLSVADRCFWDLCREQRVTTFAGVPYTFELLDRAGFPGMELPHLRYLTQAGGRMAPERVAAYADLGRRRGWDLYVMYGQTEATARMAYLPPDLAAEHPETIGIPVPGGSFRIEPVAGEEPGTGELVFSGPNVMLGYAERPADLALGRTVHELRTGDLARRTADGLYQVVGRRARFAKIFGLRIDPGRIETALAARGITAHCTGTEDALVVAVTTDTGTGTDTGAAPDTDRIRRLAAAEAGLPARVVRVLALPGIPRLASGKPDYRALAALAAGPESPAAAPSGTAPSGTAGELCRQYALMLDRPDVTENDSFIGLGGDSLSYVEMSLRLEAVLGRLPADWHTLPIRDLARPPAGPDTASDGAGGPAGAGSPAGSARPGRRRPRLHTMETGVLLRAAAIVLIVGSHIPVFFLQGGAHVLLGVAGYNFARFHLTAAPRRERLRHARRSIARIALPSMAWIGGVVLVTGAYDPFNALLLNSAFGSMELRTRWHYWFVETLVYFLVAIVLLLAVPLLDRWERRFPLAFPLALVALGLITRFDLPGLRLEAPHLRPVVVFWLFALGWAAARAVTVRQRLLVSAVPLATVPGFFPGQTGRQLTVIGGLLLLIWISRVPSLGPVNRLAGLLAGSSLYIYLTHWQVFRLLQDAPDVLALAACLAFGIGYAALVTRVMRRLPRLRRALRRAPRRRGTPGAGVIPAGRRSHGTDRPPDHGCPRPGRTECPAAR
ncbi:AMP-binding protein [Streptomyces sp. YIM 98790]|uniref:AMP-binding protein n=1 Tax=Streptomyces sp. YIM 98790 TaxID=2689077 RepID=UPI0014078AF0|nr:AMP-binding protein [Streptomyces sp. YIM 98790]